MPPPLVAILAGILFALATGAVILPLAYLAGAFRGGVYLTAFAGISFGALFAVHLARTKQVATIRTQSKPRTWAEEYYPQADRSVIGANDYLERHGKFPAPDRSHIRRNRHISMGQSDLGWFRGVIDDGHHTRPFLAETWADEGHVTNQTIFFSRIGMEDMTAPRLLAMFRSAGLIGGTDNPPCGLLRVEDRSGHPLWSLNVCLASDTTVHVEDPLPAFAYDWDILLPESIEQSNETTIMPMVKILYQALQGLERALDCFRNDTSTLGLPAEWQAKATQMASSFSGLLHDLRTEVRNLEDKLGLRLGEEPFDPNIANPGPNVTIGFIRDWLTSEVQSVALVVSYLGSDALSTPSLRGHAGVTNRFLATIEAWRSGTDRVLDAIAARVNRQVPINFQYADSHRHQITPIHQSANKSACP